MPEMDGYGSPARSAGPEVRHDRLIDPVRFGQPDDRRRTPTSARRALVKPVEHDVLNAALG